MKLRTLLLLLVFITAGKSFAQQNNRKLDNATAFTKLFGYVRYFHPSDEAAVIDWEKFAIYGQQEVAASKNLQELKATLTRLFKPIAPTIEIYLENESIKFDQKELTPSQTKKYETIAWQHAGLGLGDTRSPYKSSRTNRSTTYKPAGNSFGPVVKLIKAPAYQEKEFIFTGNVKLAKGTGTGHLWVRVDKAGDQTGFFDNMGNRPVKSGEWKSYEIKGTIDKDAEEINVGAFLSGHGELLLDDISLKINENGTWKEIYTESFSNDKQGKEPQDLIPGTSSKASAGKAGYSYVIQQNDKNKADKWLAIISNEATIEKKPALLFNAYPKVGEYISKPIGDELKAIIPLALYGTNEQTYPAADKALLTQLQAKLKAIPDSDINGANLYTRLGNITITWNVFQHFYPYFDIVKTNWNQDLQDALSRAYTDKSAVDFQNNLQLLTAKLQDGHVRVSSKDDKATHRPPIKWEWIENKLVITEVFDTTVPASVGDIVTNVNGVTPEDYFADVNNHISAATKGWLNYRAQSASLAGEQDSDIKLTVLKADNSTADLQLKRTISFAQTSGTLKQPDPITELESGIMYINLDVAQMEAINKAMPQLQKSKAIICDLRGYPRGNHELIMHLLAAKDTSSQWMQIPQYIYPDQEKMVGYQKENWLGMMKPKNPRLTAKIIFLTDGRAISYAESFMSFIEHYDLATIVGQPTAGTNGNVNPFTLPGGYYVSWTGMKVQKHNGSPLHGVGILPNVYVEKTIQGVRENKDEFLEKALEIAREAI